MWCSYIVVVVSAPSRGSRVRYKQLSEAMTSADEFEAEEAAQARAALLSDMVHVGSLPPLRPHEKEYLTKLQRRMDTETLLRSWGAVALILEVCGRLCCWRAPPPSPPGAPTFTPCRVRMPPRRT